MLFPKTERLTNGVGDAWIHERARAPCSLDLRPVADADVTVAMQRAPTRRATSTSTTVGMPGNAPVSSAALTRAPLFVPGAVHWSGAGV